jgi:hypothetical protein
MTVSLLKYCRSRTQIDAFIVSSSHATRSCSIQLRWYNYSSKASSSSPYIRSMILVKLFTKRCILSSASTQGIIAPFNMDVSSSLLSSSLLSPSPGVISDDDDDDDDDDNDNVDSEAEKTHQIRWKVMCSKTCCTSDYGIISRYRSSSYPSSHVKRSYSTEQMRMMMMMSRSRRTFSTIGNAHTYM